MKNGKISAFIIRDTQNDKDFIEQFLSSSDFTHNEIGKIGKSIGVYSNSSKKSEDINTIVNNINDFNKERIASLVIKNLVARKKEWISFKIGRVSQFPILTSPNEIVFSRGSSKWYGPVDHPDDTSGSKWYIRPVFISHREPIDDQSFMKVEIRWLCFARINTDSISIYWRGFSHIDDEEGNINRANQFHYWNYITDLFKEIEDITKASVNYVGQLSNILLHELWNLYDNNNDYDWIHKRIRAEASGLSFNARAGSVLDFAAGGLTLLAEVIRKAVSEYLFEKQKYELIDEEDVDKHIIITIMRNYGTLSYEFLLKNEDDYVFKAHVYFGAKPQSDTADKIQHMKMDISSGDNIKQIDFLIDHIRRIS